MISCQVCWRITEMAQRSKPALSKPDIRDGPPKAQIFNRKRAGGIHHGQESLIPQKAEYIGADQIVIRSFRLQTSGGPYIADIVPVNREALPSIGWVRGQLDV